ncbi:hypothetical protein DL738_11500 [Escherichia coli]|nr:hypothetical protein [Escherichia coli]
MHENQVHLIIDALSKDKYVYIALMILVIHLLMKQVSKHHKHFVDSKRIYDDHKAGKVIDETPDETLTMIKKSVISIWITLISVIATMVLTTCFFFFL